jgi:serine/threonine protein kinase
MIAPLAAGAMGEVYRARDSRLDREVALKIITPEAADDPTRQRRFEREARAASSLNHPNILTVHDFGSDSGISYIVSELLEGESLRQVIDRGPLAIRKLLDICVQIADGLAAAHQAGIVHRDLKPENIMIMTDNRVKILDFGLAKSVQPFSDDQTLSHSETQPGLILGTVAYMSPEQAGGSALDFRSDQFAFGLILFEMATGRKAFHRDNPLQTLSAILTEEAPPMPNVPAPLQWVVERCLAKEPGNRYSSTQDLYRELRAIREHLTQSYASPSMTGIEGRLLLRRHSGAIIAVLVALLLGFLLARALTLDSGTELTRYHFTPVASGPGLEVFPAWSPNGRSVAYTAEVDGVFQIFTRSVARELGPTVGTPITKSEADSFFPAWSADGSHVLYISAFRGVPGLWSTGAAGGSPQLLMENVAQAATSPDGQTLIFLRDHESGADSHSLWIASPPGTAPRKYDRMPFAAKRFFSWSYLRFSPDGSKIGAWVSVDNGHSEFWILPFPSGTPKQGLTTVPMTTFARQFSWMPDSRHVIFAERRGLSIDSHLWMADTARNTVQPLTAGTDSEQAPSVSPDGKSVAFAAMDTGYDLVETPLDGSGLRNLLSTHLSEVSPAWAPVGNQYAYVTDRSGNPEIWLKSVQERWERPLVTSKDFGDDSTSFLFDVTFSPDGQRIAYSRAGKPGEGVWISTLNGNAPVRLAQEPHGEFQRGPTWSPDGNWIAYFTIRGGKFTVQKARVGGGERPVVLRDGVGSYPAWSPAGDWIACSGPAGIVLISPDGQNTRALSPRQWLVHGWSKDGKTIYGIRQTGSRRLVLASMDVATGAEKTVSDLGPYPASFAYGSVMGALPLRGFSRAPDGKSFATSIIRPSSDIWLLAGFEPRSWFRRML